ncbi:hypothetical protein B0T24DRAFT_591893 [Lasiosphaeria ovina]|uniref:Uncharacterized protein n=1 Tax=Lasiosphaeria ovina TaxID=92902 RepID=A0AAE0NAL1_9PEZI|nr:hypothetical protein B0T24DRAFT_591893 [Lasiosphaeria ovina]
MSPPKSECALRAVISMPKERTSRCLSVALMPERKTARQTQAHARARPAAAQQPNGASKKAKIKHEAMPKKEEYVDCGSSVAIGIPRFAPTDGHIACSSSVAMGIPRFAPIDKFGHPTRITMY